MAAEWMVCRTRPVTAVASTSWQTIQQVQPPTGRRQRRHRPADPRNPRSVEDLDPDRLIDGTGDHPDWWTGVKDGVREDFAHAQQQIVQPLPLRELVGKQSSTSRSIERPDELIGRRHEPFQSRRRPPWMPSRWDLPSALRQTD